MIDPLRYHTEQYSSYEIERPVFCAHCLAQKATRNNPHIASYYCTQCPSVFTDRGRVTDTKEYGGFLCSAREVSRHKHGITKNHKRQLLVVGPGLRKKLIVRGDGVNFPMPLDMVTVRMKAKIYFHGYRIHQEPSREFSFVSGLSGRCLHIQVLGARNLRVADFNGTSDPFIVYSFCGRPLHATRVRHRTLNPRWENETILVPCDEEIEYNPRDNGMNSQKDMIKLEVYDKDILSSNEFLGHVEIHRSKLLKLAVVAEGQVIRLPLNTREFSGILHLQFAYLDPPIVVQDDEKSHVSSASNQSSSSLQQQQQQMVLVRIVCAEDLEQRNQDIFQSSRAYVKVILGKDTVLGHTPVVKNATRNPIWSHGHEFQVKLSEVLAAESYMNAQTKFYLASTGKDQRRNGAAGATGANNNNNPAAARRGSVMGGLMMPPPVKRRGGILLDEATGGGAGGGNHNHPQSQQQSDLFAMFNDLPSFLAVFRLEVYDKQSRMSGIMKNDVLLGTASVHSEQLRAMIPNLPPALEESSPGAISPVLMRTPLGKRGLGIIPVSTLSGTSPVAENNNKPRESTLARMFSGRIKTPVTTTTETAPELQSSNSAVGFDDIPDNEEDSEEEEEEEKDEEHDNDDDDIEAQHRPGTGRSDAKDEENDEEEEEKEDRENRYCEQQSVSLEAGSSSLESGSSSLLLQQQQQLSQETPDERLEEQQVQQPGRDEEEGLGSNNVMITSDRSNTSSSISKNTTSNSNQKVAKLPSANSLPVITRSTRPKPPSPPPSVAIIQSAVNIASSSDNNQEGNHQIHQSNSVASSSHHHSQGQQASSHKAASNTSQSKSKQSGSARSGSGDVSSRSSQSESSYSNSQSNQSSSRSSSQLSSNSRSVTLRPRPQEAPPPPAAAALSSSSSSVVSSSLSSAAAAALPPAKKLLTTTLFSKTKSKDKREEGNDDEDESDDDDDDDEGESNNKHKKKLVTSTLTATAISAKTTFTNFTTFTTSSEPSKLLKRYLGLAGTGDLKTNEHSHHVTPAPEINWSPVYRLQLSRDSSKKVTMRDILHPDDDDYGYLVVRLLPANRGYILHGLDEAVRHMTIGETSHIKCRYDYAYANYCLGANVPPRSNIVFTVQLLEINGWGRYTSIFRMVRRFYRVLLDIYERGIFQWIGRMLISAFDVVWQLITNQKGGSAFSKDKRRRGMKGEYLDSEDEDSNDGAQNDNDHDQDEATNSIRESEMEGSSQQSGSEEYSEDDEGGYDEKASDDDDGDGGNNRQRRESSRVRHRSTRRSTRNRSSTRIFDGKRRVTIVKPEPRVKKHLNPSVREGARLMWGRKILDEKQQKAVILEKIRLKKSKNLSKNLRRTVTEKLGALQELLDEDNQDNDDDEDDNESNEEEEEEKRSVE